MHSYHLFFLFFSLNKAISPQLNYDGTANSVGKKENHFSYSASNKWLLSKVFTGGDTLSNRRGAISQEINWDGRENHFYISGASITVGPMKIRYLFSWKILEMFFGRLSLPILSDIFKSQSLALCVNFRFVTINCVFDCADPCAPPWVTYIASLRWGCRQP